MLILPRLSLYYLMLFHWYCQETWEKRLSYIQGMVELIGSASHIRETHTLGYSDPVTSLFQTVVDVCVNGKLS